MQFTWHLLVIIAAILIGVCLFQKSEKNANMSDDQLKEADMYRNYAYILFAVAIIVAVYYYYIQGNVKASMYGYKKASMCNAKAHMPGCTIQY